MLSDQEKNLIKKAKKLHKTILITAWVCLFAGIASLTFTYLTYPSKDMAKTKAYYQKMSDYNPTVEHEILMKKYILYLSDHFFRLVRRAQMAHVIFIVLGIILLNSYKTNKRLLKIIER